mgnify:CR=1 FL=1
MLVQAGLFLLDTLAGFVCILLLLRFYMQALRVSFRNPLGGFVVQATNWLVLPLRRVLPGLFGLDNFTHLGIAMHRKHHFYIRKFFHNLA